MSRMAKFFYFTVLVMMFGAILTLLGESNQIITSNTSLNICGIFWCILILEGLFILVTYIMYYLKRKKKVNKKYIAKYNLKLLDNSDGTDICVKKICSRDGDMYLFSYIDENNRINNKNISYMDVEVIDGENKNMVSVYEREFIVKGFLDYLYFNEKLANNHKYLYVLNIGEVKKVI